MRGIYCIVGPSGSGKTTVAKALAARHNYRVLGSYTDRAPRFEGEEGHTFLSPSEYDKLTGIVAETFFDNHRYCATSEQIDNNDIYIVDPKGIITLKERYKGSKNIFVIYLSLDSEKCRERMLADNRPEQSVDERIEHDKAAFAQALSMANAIVNADRTREEVAYTVNRLIQRQEDRYDA